MYTPKEKQPVKEDVLVRRASAATEQIQAWGQKNYTEVRAKPDFSQQTEIPGFLKRVKVSNGNSLDLCTVMLPPDDRPLLRPLRLRTDFGLKKDLYFYDLVMHPQQDIKVTEVRDGHQYNVDPLTRTTVIQRARKFFESASFTVSLERRISNPVGPGVVWQTLKTENLAVI